MKSKKKEKTRKSKLNIIISKRISLGMSPTFTLPRPCCAPFSFIIFSGLLLSPKNMFNLGALNREILSRLRFVICWCLEVFFPWQFPYVRPSVVIVWVAHSRSLAPSPFHFETASPEKMGGNHFFSKRLCYKEDRCRGAKKMKTFWCLVDRNV